MTIGRGGVGESRRGLLPRRCRLPHVARGSNPGSLVCALRSTSVMPRHATAATGTGATTTPGVGPPMPGDAVSSVGSLPCPDAADRPPTRWPALRAHARAPPAEARPIRPHRASPRSSMRRSSGHVGYVVDGQPFVTPTSCGARATAWFPAWLDGQSGDAGEPAGARSA